MSFRFRSAARETNAPDAPLRDSLGAVPASRFHGMIDWMLVLGALFAVETQLRSESALAGPGEILLAIWIGACLVGVMVRHNARAGRAWSELCAFWAVFALALSLGLIQAILSAALVDTSLAIHDVVADGLAAALCLLATLEPGARARLRAVEWRIALTGGLLLALQLANAAGLFSLGEIDPWYWDRMRGWCANPNQFAFFCLMLTFLGLHLADTSAGLPRAVAGLCCALALVGGSFAASNAYVLVVAGGLSFFAALKGLRWLLRQESRRSPAAPLVAAGALLVVYLALILAPLSSGAGDLVKNAGDLARDSRNDMEDQSVRLELWIQALRRGAESGMLGFGPGPHLEIPSIVSAGRQATGQPANMQHPQEGAAPNFEAHNTVLELLVQGGLVAACDYVLIVALAVWRSWRVGADGMASALLAINGFGSFHVIFRHPLLWLFMCSALAAAPKRRAAGHGQDSFASEGHDMLKRTNGLRPQLGGEANSAGWAPAQPPSPEGSGEWRRALKAVGRRRAMVLACAVCGLVLAVVAAAVLTPRYTATAMLLVSKSDAGGGGRPDDDGVDMPIAVMMSDAYLARVIAASTTDPNFRAYRRVADLRRHLKVMQVMRSHLLSVDFSDRSPVAAAGVANAIAQAYVDESLAPLSQAAAQAFARQERRIGQLDAETSQPTAKGTARGEEMRRALDAARTQLGLMRSENEMRQEQMALAPPVSVYAMAQPPELPSSIRPLFLILPAGVAALLFGVALALLLARLDSRIRDAGDLERICPAPLLGRIPPKLLFGPVSSSLGHDPKGYEAAMQRLAARIFLGGDCGAKCATLVVGMQARSAADFAVDLALSAAQMKEVLLIAIGDDRMTTRCADHVNRALAGGARIDFLPMSGSGALAAAASGELARKMQELRDSRDWIVVAAPPCSASPAAAILARMVDSIVLNVSAGATCSEEVADALREFATTGEFCADSPLSRLALVLSTGAGPAPADELIAKPEKKRPKPLFGRAPLDAPSGGATGGKHRQPAWRRWIGPPAPAKAQQKSPPASGKLAMKDATK